MAEEGVTSPMDPTVVVSIAVSLVSVVVAGLSWLTSARKTRVDNLCKIIDAQSTRIDELGADLRDATARIEDLEAENQWYRVIFSREGIDPDTYCKERDNGAAG